MRKTYKKVVITYKHGKSGRWVATFKYRGVPYTEWKKSDTDVLCWAFDRIDELNKELGDE